MSHLKIESTPKSTGIYIDGEDFAQGHVIDFIQLARSGVADGEYFLLTCGCGEPGCAGLFIPIEVTSDSDKVYWHVTEPGPERWFTFTKSDYRAELKGMIKSIFSLSKRASSHISYVHFDRDRLREFMDQL